MPYTPGTIGRRIAEHLRANGVDATAHKLRATFATELAEQLAGLPQGPGRRWLQPGQAFPKRMAPGGQLQGDRQRVDLPQLRGIEGRPPLLLRR